MTVDAISLEVFKNLLISVAEEMGIVLQRAAFSPNIRERLDFSCAIFDGEARMVAQAAHIPVHLGSMPASVVAALSYPGDLEPGDIIALNDPFRGGTHLPDVTLVSPVFLDDETVFFVASRAHHADVGGMSPGSLPLSTELYQEGIIIPPVKLVSGGELNRDVLALITANSRAPEERVGDFRAQIAAHRIGEARLRSLAEAHGVDVLIAHAAALQEYSDALTRDLIRQIPGGRYHYTDVMESDGQTEESVTISCWIDVSGDQIIVDFAGTSAQVAGNINAVPAIVRSATYYCVQLLASEAIPVNDGCFRPIEVRVPEGSLLNPAFPAAVAVGNTETSQRIVDTVLGALSGALPGRIPAAGQGTMNNLTIGGQRADGSAFVYYETIGGGHGAGPDGDGLSGRHSHMTNTLNTPVEALEYALPFRVSAYHLRDGTGGAGRWRGGDGIVRTYEFLTPVTVTVNSERRRAAPAGRAGGSDGTVGENIALRRGLAESLPGKATARFAPGDRLSIRTPSGGGWGADRPDRD